MRGNILGANVLNHGLKGNCHARTGAVFFKRRELNRRYFFAFFFKSRLNTALEEHLNVYLSIIDDLESKK